MRKTHGFSLLELSIVLVIIGLLLGGVFAGRHLLRSSELKGIFAEVTEYSNAVMNFKDKFGYLPGDMPNATTIWGAADGGDGIGTDCWDTDSTGSVLTCNGNGNGGIDAHDASYKYETFRAWQQLSNAEMIGGKYSGRYNQLTASKLQAVPGVNVPAFKGDASVGYTLFYLAASAMGSMTNWYAGIYDQHVMVVGKQYNNVETRGPFLSAGELLSIDTKNDDGMPGTGMIRTWNTGVYPNCASSDDPATATYLSVNTEDNRVACAMLVMLGF